jgi:beta-lactam-binding protein with PASTA domain
MDDTDGFRPPGRSPVATAVITSIVTTVAVFFGLRALEQRGVFSSSSNPPVAPQAAPTPSPVSSPSPVDVPSLLGMRPEQARELLQGRGLLLTFSVERESAEYPAGTVAEQVPLPGSQLPKGGAVQAVLSRGAPAPAPKPIPKLTGLRLRAARELLEQQGFKAGKIRYDSDGDRSSGVVLDQKPAPPATALPGTPVDLTVNED